MATIADFVGTWYFRGVRTAPCYMQMQGTTQLKVTDEQHQVRIGNVQGGTVVLPGNAYTGELSGVISSDAKRIAWSNGESWER